MRYFLSFILTLIISNITFANKVVDKADKYLQESKYDSAIYYYDLIINDCKAVCHDTTLAQIYVHKAKTLKLKEQFELALNDYTIALNLYKKHDHANGVLYTLVNLTEFYRALHQFEKALSHIQEAKKLIESENITTKNKAYFYLI